MMKHLKYFFIGLLALVTIVAICIIVVLLGKWICIRKEEIIPILYILFVLYSIYRIGKLICEEW